MTLHMEIYINGTPACTHAYTHTHPEPDQTSFVKLSVQLESISIEKWLKDERWKMTKDELHQWLKYVSNWIYNVLKSTAERN